MSLQHVSRFLAAAALVALLVSCVLPGTATLHLRNSTSFTITKVEFIPDGESTGTDRLAGGTIAGGGSHSFYGVPPGTYDIRLTLQDRGSYTAFSNLVLEVGEWVDREVTTAPM
jgi:hypothetical protein